MKRLVLNQTNHWYNTVNDHGAYSHNHCCFCGKPLTTKFAWLMLSRDDGGEWYVVDPQEPQQDDEKDFGRFALPIGMTCLKRHPEFQFAITSHPND